MTREDVWTSNESVVVLLTLKSFRVGGISRKPSGASLQQLMIRNSYDEKSHSDLPASSFRGVLRSSVLRVMASLDLGLDFEKSFLCLFGSPFSEENQTTGLHGTMIVTASEKNHEVLDGDGVRLEENTSIAIDEKFGSVLPRSLWSYEYVAMENRTVLGYDLRFLYPIDSRQAALLLAGIRFLKYGFIGGYSSRGLGLITNVEVRPREFVSFAHVGLGEIME